MLFLFGAAMTYVHYFIFPIPMSIQLLASGFLALILGSLGPSFGELIEWIFFFSFGIFTAVLSPQIIYTWKTGQLGKKEILATLYQTLPYCIELLSVWIVLVPVGYVFFKITSSQKRYYRHARFF